jgi:hypothetical protein
MSVLLSVLRGADEALSQFLVQQMTALVVLLKAHMRKWLPDILQLIADFWSPTSPLLPHLLKLLSELAGERPICSWTLAWVINLGGATDILGFRLACNCSSETAEIDMRPVPWTFSTHTTYADLRGFHDCSASAGYMYCWVHVRLEMTTVLRFCATFCLIDDRKLAHIMTHPCTGIFHTTVHPLPPVCCPRV